MRATKEMLDKLCGASPDFSGLRLGYSEEECRSMAWDWWERQREIVAFWIRNPVLMKKLGGNAAKFQAWVKERVSNKGGER
ncbi:hypothetical protein LCGC14_1736640 [marine sediment metagenome]|uniref:Uncharacterized protein n=1 Tax=marine sediment metagenome TaxID=412755 RepID=A0A0F9JNB1_9ZZZZ